LKEPVLPDESNVYPVGLVTVMDMT
jgi:hypothetical protein